MAERKESNKLDLVQKTCLGSLQQKAPASTGRGKGLWMGSAQCQGLVLGVPWRISFHLLLPTETRHRDSGDDKRKKFIMPKIAL